MAETWGGWTSKFLKALGAPATKENLAAIYAMIANEGTSINWNPLAITGAGSPGNSVGVGNFPDEVTGISATVNFLNTPGANDYPGRIVRPLQVGNGRQALSGFDATGSWAGDFPRAYNSYDLYVSHPEVDGPYGHSPLLADPGHGQGDIGSISGKLGDVTGIKPLNTLEDAVNAIGDALGAIAKFFGALTEKQTWIRIGEILGGTILLALALGLAKQDLYPGVAKTVREIAETVGVNSGG